MVQNTNSLIYRRRYAQMAATIFLVAAMLLAAVGSAAATPVSPQPTPAPTGAQPAKVTGTQPAKVTGAQPAKVTGPIVVDSGFRPEVNGFSFRNYGEGYENLTPVEMQRLFGTKVCAAHSRDACILTPPATQWMERYNKAMSGGHCYGFSVLSQLFFSGDADSKRYGAPDPARLDLATSRALQREIAYTWTFQALDAVHSQAIKGTPNEILDATIRDLKAAKSTGETVALAFLDRTGRGGHAVTPYAVEDRGAGQFAILVYDGNFPGQQRALLIDRSTNTWRYNASVNPNRPTSRYAGDAKTRSLFLFPNRVGLGVQPCPFCADAGNVTSAGRQSDSSFGAFNQLYLDGDAQNLTHLIIADAAGRQYGYVNGKLVTDIPGVQHRSLFDAGALGDAHEPVFYVPANLAVSVTIDGSEVQKPGLANVVMIGPGYALGALNVKVGPGYQPSILHPAPDGRSFSFEAGQGEAPTFFAGIETADLDYEFRFDGMQLDEGSQFNLQVDEKEGTVGVNLTGTGTPANYNLEILRIDPQGESTFNHKNLSLDPESVVYLDYSSWTEKQGVPMEIDANGDGTIDDTEYLPDQAIDSPQDTCPADDPQCDTNPGDPPSDEPLPGADITGDTTLGIETSGGADQGGTSVCDSDGTCYDADGNPIDNSSSGSGTP